MPGSPRCPRLAVAAAVAALFAAPLLAQAPDPCAAAWQARLETFLDASRDRTLALCKAKDIAPTADFLA